MEQLPGSSNNYRIAAGPHQGRKVFTLQTLADSTAPLRDGVGKVGGFSFARDRHRDCPACCGAMRIIACIEDPGVVEKRSTTLM